MSNLAALISDQLSGSRAGLAIVFYHVAMSAGNEMERWRGGVACDYSKDIAISVNAARQHHPEATVVMLTDAATEFDNHDMHVIRLPVGQELGMERTRAQIAFSRVWAGPALHLDTDMEIRKPVHPLFTLPFDFGLTWRPEIPAQQINGGMFLVRTPSSFVKFQTAVLTLIPAIAEAYQHPPMRTAFGEQRALHMLWENRPSNRVYQTQWGNMAVLPCESVNYTYRDGDTSGAAKDAYVWHRKGSRKIGMVKAA